MIKSGFKFYASYPKVAKGRTLFQIRDYDKTKPDEKNYCTVMANNEVTVGDRDEIRLGDITGVSLQTYKEKLQVTIFADVEVIKAHEQPKPDPTPYYPEPHDDFGTGPLVDINSDDLPF